MARDRTRMRNFYSFIHNKNGQYFSFVDNALVTTDYEHRQPLEFNPSNLKEMVLSFGTNKTYSSGVRSLLINWLMVGDGCEIIRNLKYNGKGYGEEIYFVIERFNPNDDSYHVYYEGRFDLAQTKDTMRGFEAPCLDDSAWGLLSQNDSVKYSIDCTSKAKNAVPILFDGISLKSRYTWQTVNVQFKIHNDEGILFDHPINLPLVSSDGDSSGIVTQGQSYIPEDGGPYSQSNFMYKPNKINQAHLWGTFSYQAKSENAGDVGTQLTVRTNFRVIKIASNDFHINDTFITQRMSFDVTIDLQAGEYISLFLGGAHSTQAAGDNDWVILPDLTNVYIETRTKSDPTIVYGRRPLDVLQEIVEKGTNGKYKADSIFYSTNKNKVITCGNALRSSTNAMIQSSFNDWFRSYDIEDFIAFRIIDNQIWIEPLTVVYDDSTNLFDVGEVTDFEISDAYDYLCNEIELNMNKQDYNHTSGRLEFNGRNTFFAYQYNVKNKLSLISPYRKDCYGMEFIRLDYQQLSTIDDSGDTNVFMVEITNQTGVGGSNVFNFESFDINHLPLSPIIYYPKNGDIILNNKPIVRGACQPNTRVNIYVDGVFDGFTTSGATANGLWSYDIQTALAEYQQDVNDGVHLIEATFTDLTGVESSVSVTILNGVQAEAFENVHDGDSLYDNLPMLRGFMESGKTLGLLVDGVTKGVLTGDGNNRWAFRIQQPLTNGAHTISIGTAVINVNIFSFVEIPLITSFKDGVQLVNNLPLVEGVAAPSTTVNLYLDYYPDVKIGTTTANATGNWSFQLVPLFKTDGSTVLTPIPNGNHIISTGLSIDSVKVNITGFTLNRPAYTSIEAVLDDSVFNTQLTPKHNLLNRMRYWKSIFFQQPDTIIKFETGDKNVAFSTTLNGVTTKENSDVKIFDYQDLPIFLPYIFNCTVETPFFFAETITSFNQGGLVKMTHKGFDIWCLPIGKMTVEDVVHDVQKWSLLISAKTPLSTLLNLSKFVSNLSLMDNTIYRSDYNTLHMVKYNIGVEEPEIHEDWFEHRNDRWVNNPIYIQKIRIDDGLIDQIITNFPYQRTIQLRAFDGCGKLKATYVYAPVNPSPIQAPDVLQEVTVDLEALGEGDFYFVMFVDYLAAAISELVSIRKEHYGTIFIDGASKLNKTNVVFSNGWRARVRVEGLVQKWIGDIESIINEDEIGNFDNLNAILSKKRTVLFGDGTGIPDWLYLKICNIILLDNLFIQRVGYTISPDASIEPTDKIPGYPSYQYAVNFRLTDNIQGFNFNEFMPYNQIIDNAIMADDDRYIDAEEEKPLLRN